jgi:biotin transport system permease protein
VRKDAEAMLSLYISQATWLHSIPAGWKLVSLATASVALLPTQSVAVLMVAAVLGIAGFLSLGGPGRHRLENLLRTAGLLAAFIGLFQFVVVVGEFGPQDALLTGMISALRLLSLVLLADLISVTTPIGKMLNVMGKLLGPLNLMGVRTDRLALVVGLMVRSASLLRQHFQTMADAYRARVGKSGGIRVIAPLIRQAANANLAMADTLESRRLRSAVEPPLRDKTA